MSHETAAFAVEARAEATLPVLKAEACTAATVRRVAAMLDLDPDDPVEGAWLPRGWHFVLLGADTRRSALRGDGFPGLGVPMPELGLPRLMLGSRSVRFLQDIPVGSNLTRRSAVRELVHKTTSKGPMAVVTISHELRLDNHADPALTETQTYLLLPPRPAGEAAPEPALAAPPAATHQKTLVPDEALLFQYSALGFNSHRIHFDRQHASEVEGYPDLVVNGGLATLLMTEFLRRELRVRPASLVVRHVAPLYCHRPMTIAADTVAGGWQLRAFDDGHRVAVEMEVAVQ